MPRKKKKLSGGSDMTQVQTLPTKLQPRPLQSFDEWLKKSIEKTIRENTPEKARKALSRLSMYDDNGNLIEE
ncbi:hypothetical protein FACS1894184_08450 [Clostridia bacterium]|nr:hypothetical protein FACS1894184_08450 [Clostridia bacterium]